MITSTAIGRGGLGRFGNQLFTIAGVIGIAIKNNHTYGFPKWMNYDNALFGGEVTDFSEHFVNPLPDDREQKFIEYGYFWGYRDINLPEGNWSINAHLQSPKFFEHCIDTVRHYFKLKHEPDEVNGVAVHFRGGDYIDDSRAYHPRQSKEYYRKAMSLMPEGSRFYVLTDDADAARRVFDGIEYDVTIMADLMNRDIRLKYEEPYYLADFAFMKKCKHFIIANSSFSAMAAHLGEHPEKKVVAPKLWFGEQANGMETKDIYDKNWTVI